MTNKIEDKRHSELGASICERWLNCPGSVHLAKCSPVAPTNFYAAEGTVAHELAANTLARSLKLPFNAIYDVGDKIECEGHEIKVKDEMVDAVDMYVNHIHSLIKKYSIKTKNIMIEKTVTIPGAKVVGDQLFGSPDFVGYEEFGTIAVSDFKYGSGTPVNAYKNRQAMFYGLGGLFGMHEFDRDNITQADLSIVQPRNGGITTYIAPRSELDAFHQELIVGAERVAPGAETKAGSWCKFCPAILTCPAQEALRKNELQLDFTAAVPKPNLPDVTVLPDDQLAKLLNALDVIDIVADAARAEARSRLDAGKKIAGWKLIQGYGHRKWVDSAEATAKLEAVLGDKIYKKDLHTPAQIEKLIKKEKISVNIGELTERPMTQPKLVPETHADKALEASIHTDFV